MVYEWVTFSWKTGICMGLLSNSVAAHIPTKTKLEYPPGPGFGNYAGTSVHSVQRGLKPTLCLFISLYIKPHFLQKQTYPAFCRSCFSKINMQIYTTPLNTTIFLTIVCLRRESNFLASTRPVTALCVCCIICVQAHAYNHYAIPHAYNAANARAQGSDWAHWSQKVTLSSKAIGVTNPMEVSSLCEFGEFQHG